MVVNQKVTGRAMSIPAGIGVGLGVSLLLTVIGCAATAALILSGSVGEDAIGYGAMLVLLLSAGVGSLIAASLIKHRKLLVCMILGICYFGLLLLINGIAFGGAVTGAGVTALLIFAGCSAAALLSTDTVGKGSRKRRKLHTG